MTRKRRILIAAIAAVGILFMWLLAKPPESPEFFDYLVRRPAACKAARAIFTLAGRQKEFDQKIFWSKLRRADKQQREW